MERDAAHDSEAVCLTSKPRTVNENAMKSKLKIIQRRKILAPGIRAKRRVDPSDIKALDQKCGAHAERNPFYRPVKLSTTVRIDADVLAWLQSQGKSY
jgi:uncharacterized protein (DUF4415 family)